MMRRTALSTTAAAALLALAPQIHAYAVSPRPAPSGPEEGFSPLFAKRLEVGVENMDKPADRLFMAELMDGEFPVETPFSANPASLCLASGCFGSACLGSACLASACIGSACANSKCMGSACAVSVCGGSACAGSTCAGSACVGSICVGSVCTGSACYGSACVSCAPLESDEGGTRG